MTTHDSWWSTLLGLITELETLKLDYMLADSAALFVQGVDLPRPTTIDIIIQWDLFQRAHEYFQHAGAVEHGPGEGHFSFTRHSITVAIHWYYNTVVVTDPDRLRIEHSGRQIWVKALDYYIRVLPASDTRVRAIKAYLRRLQQQNNSINASAWNQNAYDAWIERFGTPHEASIRIKKDPWSRLLTLSAYIGDPAGKKVINLLGSHGTRAIALALLGADVTVVDISHENAQYAQAVAQEAGTHIRYIVADVLTLAAAELNASYDLVLMEMGVLHYFVDLEPLISMITGLLRSGGRLVLQDFHPISTKLITSKGKRHIVNGNYFDKSLTATPVAFGKHLSSDKQATIPTVYLRKWTLGEVVTAVAQANLFIRLLNEEPNIKIDDIGIPKVFTIVAEKRL